MSGRLEAWMMRKMERAVRSPVISAGRATWAWQLLAGVALMCVASQVRLPVPGTEVPMTLQSLGALLCGYLLSPSVAVAAMLGYLALGAAGLGVFAGPEGLFGSTGGYLIGFVLCAGLVSVLKGPMPGSIGRLMAAGLVGMLAVFACGVVGQVVVKGSFELALMQGAAPFLGKACVQLALAVALVRRIAGRTGSNGGNRP